MARRRKSGESLYAYFQRLFQENPEWLDSPTNDAIYDRYRSDYGLPADEPLAQPIRNALANKKSLMKKALRESGQATAGDNGTRRRGRGRGRRAVVAAAQVTAPTGPRPSGMKNLEEQIDECLFSAQALDRQALEGVIKMLRSARDAVVVMAHMR